MRDARCAGTGCGLIGAYGVTRGVTASVPGGGAVETFTARAVSWGAMKAVYR